MGRGDKRTRKGKISLGTFGVTRLRQRVKKAKGKQPVRKTEA